MSGRSLRHVFRFSAHGIRSERRVGGRCLWPTSPGMRTSACTWQVPGVKCDKVAPPPYTLTKKWAKRKGAGRDQHQAVGRTKAVGVQDVAPLRGAATLPSLRFPRRPPKTRLAAPCGASTLVAIHVWSTSHASSVSANRLATLDNRPPLLPWGCAPLAEPRPVMPSIVVQIHAAQQKSERVCL